MVIYKETKAIEDHKLRPLYESVGWISYTEKVEDLQTLLIDCQIVYSAWDEDQLVGLIRTIGDGISIQYVQDILVRPQYRKQGIGQKMMQYVLEKSKDIRQFVLITDGSEENKEILEWYKKMGLIPFEKINLQGFWR